MSSTAQISGDVPNRVWKIPALNVIPIVSFTAVTKEGSLTDGVFTPTCRAGECAVEDF
jgi:hypothetical protein